MDVEIFLVLHMSAQRITVKTSTILHPDSVVGLFPSCTIGNGRVIWYYYDSLFYANLMKLPHKIKTYGEATMQMTAETFRNRVVELSEKVTDKETLFIKCR